MILYLQMPTFARNAALVHLVMQAFIPWEAVNIGKRGCELRWYIPRHDAVGSSQRDQARNFP